MSTNNTNSSKPQPLHLKPTKTSKYRSKFEARCAALLRRSGIAFEYEAYAIPYLRKARLTKQIREAHGLADTFVHHTYHMYMLDFKAQGIWIETKGWFKPSDRTKMLAVQSMFPEEKILLWFQSDNKLGKHQTYISWARKHNFLYHAGDSLPPCLRKKK